CSPIDILFIHRTVSIILVYSLYLSHTTPTTHFSPLSLHDALPISRHIFSFRESEQDTGRHREEERVVIFQIQRVYFRRQTKIQEFVGSIDDVSSPVAQCTHTEIIPATPLSQMIIVIIFVERTNT